MRRKPLSKLLRVQVLTRDNQKCCICGRSSSDISLEVDHIKPVADGGTDEINNLAALCVDCNRGKSDYRFSDYTAINLMPQEIEKHFTFLKDSDSFGDYQRYHLYCYFKISAHPGKPDDSFHREWKITGSEIDNSSDRTALEERRKQDEIRAFIGQIRTELAKERKRLESTEEGLVKR